MKEAIINEIKNTAAKNGGKPLGKDKFAKETGISENQWLGKHWTKWSEALIEAGFRPNEFNSKGYDESFLLEKLARYVIELGHFPSRAEFRIRSYKSFKDNTFPSYDSFINKLGNKASMIKKLNEFCRGKNDFKNLSAQCEALTAISQKEDSDFTYPGKSNDKIGVVYLIKAGKYFKIGKSWHSDRRHKEISLQLPEATKKLHEIKTDDIDGIEAYWHNRFKEKRKNGEWFELSANDVRIFTKRKFM